MTLVRGLVIAIVPITALLVVLPLREVFELPKTLAMHAVGLLLAALLIVSALLRPGARFRSAVGWLRPGPDRSSLGVIAFLASAALSTLFAPSPRTAFFGAWDSFFGLCTVGAGGVAFFAARHALCAPRQIDRLIAVVAGTAALVACLALVQALDLDPIEWRRTSTLDGRERIFGTLGHPNHLASFLAMTLPLQLHVLGCARTGRRRFASAAWIGALVASAAAIVLAHSRMGWLAWGAAWAASAGLSFRDDGRRAGLQAIALAMGVGALAVGLLVATPALRDEVSSVPARAESVVDAASNPRREIWRAALGMVREQPVLGVGVDGFALAFGRHRSTVLWRLEPHGTPARAHDEMLHVAATQGIAGVFAALWLLLGVVADGRMARRDGDTEIRRMAGVLLASVGALTISLVTGFLVAATATLAAVEIGVLAALGTMPRAPVSVSVDLRGDPPAAELPPRRVARFAVVCVVLAASATAFHFTVVRTARAEFAAGEGQAFASIGALADASDRFVRAVNAAPWIDRHWTLAGTAFQLAAASTPDPTERAMLLAAAYRSHATAAALVQTNAYAHGSLGRALAMLTAESPPQASRAQVEAAYERGLALDPLNLDLLQDAERTARGLGAGAWAESLERRRRTFYPESEARPGGAVAQ